MKSEDKKLRILGNKMKVKEAKMIREVTKDDKKNDDVKNLVNFFDPKKAQAGNHKPQSQILRSDAKGFNFIQPVLRDPIDLKDRCRFEESRAVFSPGKRKLDTSNEPFQLGTSQTPKKRRENRI